MQQVFNDIFAEAGRMSTIHAQEGLEQDSALNNLVSKLTSLQQAVLLNQVYNLSGTADEEALNLVRSTILIQPTAREVLSHVSSSGHLYPTLFLLDNGIATKQDTKTLDLSFLLSLADGAIKGGRTALVVYASREGIPQGRHIEEKDGLALSWGITSLLCLDALADNLCKTSKGTAEVPPTPHDFLPFFMVHGPRNAVLACLHTGDGITRYNPQNPLGNSDEAVRRFLQLLKSVDATKLEKSVVGLLKEIEPLIQLADARDPIAMALDDPTEADLKTKLARAQQITSKWKPVHGAEYRKIMIGIE